MEMHHTEDLGIRVVISEKDLQEPQPEQPKPKKALVYYITAHDRAMTSQSPV